jgi:hypothetical protein
VFGLVIDRTCHYKLILNKITLFLLHKSNKFPFSLLLKREIPLIHLILLPGTRIVKSLLSLCRKIIVPERILNLVIYLLGFYVVFIVLSLFADGVLQISCSLILKSLLLAPLTDLARALMYKPCRHNPCISLHVSFLLRQLC